MHTNFLLEDDEQDRVLDPTFIRTAPAVVAGLARAIRQAASREWTGTESEENEGADNAGNVN
ncbi:MAG: hypothetical protein ACRYFS_03880 [Janthinobacterium lividum]